jgi:hypothetical protein
MCFTVPIREKSPNMLHFFSSVVGRLIIVVGLFPQCIRMFFLRTFCPWWYFVLLDVLSKECLVSRTFCPWGRFFLWTFCASGHFVQRMFCPQNVLPQVVMSQVVLSQNILSPRTLCLRTFVYELKYLLEGKTLVLTYDRGYLDDLLKHLLCPICSVPDPFPFKFFTDPKPSYLSYYYCYVTKLIIWSLTDTYIYICSFGWPVEFFPLIDNFSQYCAYPGTLKKISFQAWKMGRFGSGSIHLRIRICKILLIPNTGFCMQLVNHFLISQKYFK